MMSTPIIALLAYDNAPMMHKLEGFFVRVSIEKRAYYSRVDTHIKLNAHTLRTGPHHFPKNFYGLFFAMQWNGQEDGFSNRHIFIRLDKYTPTIDICDEIDIAEVHGGVTDL